MKWRQRIFFIEERQADKINVKGGFASLNGNSKN
jgi:hypothetical protein